MEIKMQRFVLVTTAHRGVFAGRLVSIDGDLVTLSDARCCISWRNGKGFLGLAQDGPDHKCRISSAAPTLTLYSVTSIADCTDAARDAWLAA